MAKKITKQEKAVQEKNRQNAAKKKRNRTISILGIVIAVLLIFSMIITTIRF
ncbi:MAG TPA: hypothetical protein PLG96_06075 [Flexilinea sp.]|nr:MAG: hypothetical protein BWY58_00888 [Chloroflexi bacterium ADurb.Bin344]HOG22877.1 hypothetical protein [Flexilinea sp.]HQN63052.1 hypothetical protein [Flexilinea sp.]